MARYRDYSDVPNTCPLIDEVISAVNSVDWSEDNYWDAKTVIEIMERIRKANSELREWGNALYREKNELEDEVKSLKNELERHVEI